MGNDFYVFPTALLVKNSTFASKFQTPERAMYYVTLYHQKALHALNAPPHALYAHVRHCTPPHALNTPARPERAEALKLQIKYKAFALTGRLSDCLYTQGVALG